jgi:hypothetical protein
VCVCVKLTSAMQSIQAACLSIEQAACSGVRVCKTHKPNAIHFGSLPVDRTGGLERRVCVCKTHKRNAIHFGGIAVRGEDQRLRKAAVWDEFCELLRKNKNRIGNAGVRPDLTGSGAVAQAAGPLKGSRCLTPLLEPRVSRRVRLLMGCTSGSVDPDHRVRDAAAQLTEFCLVRFTELAGMSSCSHRQGGIVRRTKKPGLKSIPPSFRADGGLREQPPCLPFFRAGALLL